MAGVLLAPGSYLAHEGDSPEASAHTRRRVCFSVGSPVSDISDKATWKCLIRDGNRGRMAEPSLLQTAI